MLWHRIALPIQWHSGDDQFANSETNAPIRIHFLYFLETVEGDFTAMYLIIFGCLVHALRSRPRWSRGNVLASRSNIRGFKRG